MSPSHPPPVSCGPDADLRSERPPGRLGAGPTPGPTPSPALATALLVLGLVACGGGSAPLDEGGGDDRAWDQLVEAPANAPLERIEGTIRFLEVEGGVYVIRAGETDYDPTNLPEGYRVDGLAVEADIVRRDEMASIRMVGPLVEIVRIRRTGGGGGGASASASASAAPGAFSVVGFRIPGMSAMSPDEASDWEGRTVYFTDTAAASGEVRCGTPTYARSRVSTDSVLRAHRLAPGSLGLPEPTVARVEVRCGDAPWVAPGGVLLEGRDGRWLLPWDGVWFELDPMPSA